MKKVLVDMDGVLADIYTHFIALEQKESGIRLNEKDLHGKLEELAFPSFKKLVNDIGFFRTAPLIPDCVEGLRYLNEKYDVVIVSSATEFPNSLKEKLLWLNDFFPFISWKQMIFCGSKEGIRGDIMIDDHVKNLRFFEGQKILFTQPHNIYIRDASLKRVNTWKEIVEIL